MRSESNASRPAKMGGPGYDLGGRLSDLFRRWIRFQLFVVLSGRGSLASPVSLATPLRGAACSRWITRAYGRASACSPSSACIGLQSDDPCGISGVVRRDRISAHALLDGTVC